MRVTNRPTAIARQRGDSRRVIQYASGKAKTRPASEARTLMRKVSRKKPAKERVASSA